MRKLICITLFTLSVIPGISQRHLKGSKVVSLDGGLTKFGQYAGLGVSYLTGSKTYLNLDFIWESDRSIKDKSLNDFNAYYASLGFYYSPFNIKSIVYFNLGGGFAVDFTNVNSRSFNQDTKAYDPVTENYMDYGLFLSPEVEVFLSDPISLFINARQYWMPSGQIGQWILTYGGGVKIYLSSIGSKNPRF